MPATGASSGPVAQTPGRRLGCVAAVFAALAVVGLLVSAGIILIRRYEAPLRLPPPPATLSAQQLRQMKPLDGTWQDSHGSKIIFTDPGVANGAPAGRVTFVNVADLFSWQWGDVVWSPSEQGHWTITSRTTQRGGIVFWFDGPEWGLDGETVAFEVEGSISKPVLVCQYPDGALACTYTRQSAHE
jgi:hypothetical protein